MRNTTIKVMIGICAVAAVLVVGVIGGVTSLIKSNSDSDRFVDESTAALNQGDHTDKKNDVDTAESADTVSNDSSSSVKDNEPINSNAEQETSQSGDPTSESNNSSNTIEADHVETETAESQPVAAQPPVTSTESDNSSGTIEADLAETEYVESQPAATQPAATSVTTTEVPNNNMPIVNTGETDGERDQKLAIGEINSQGYEVIGITSTGTRIIGYDEKWETKGMAIMGYDSNGNPMYTTDHAKAAEINKAQVEAGVKWMEENNVHVGN